MLLWHYCKYVHTQRKLEASQILPCIPDNLGTQMVKNLPAMQKIWVPSLGWEDPLKDGMATHFSILAWRIPMDRGAWWATIHGIAKSWTRLSDSAQHRKEKIQPHRTEADLSLAHQDLSILGTPIQFLSPLDNISLFIVLSYYLYFPLPTWNHNFDTHDNATLHFSGSVLKIVLCTDWFLRNSCLKSLINRCSKYGKPCDAILATPVSTVLPLQGGQLAPEGFIFTVKCKSSVTLASGKLNIDSDISVNRKNLANSLEFLSHSLGVLSSEMFRFQFGFFFNT